MPAITRRAVRNARIGAALLAVALALWQRAHAAAVLPFDYDERPYLHAAYLYAGRMESGRWGEIPDVEFNREHPPLVKLAYGAVVKAAGAIEPDWEHIEVPAPVPDRARPAFDASRWVSAAFGVAQVAIAAAVHPLAGLLLAVDAYHAKYTSQAYLEAIPGFLLALALLLFERATRARDGARRSPPDLRLAAAAFALLGAAAAGKYPYGAVGMLAVAPLTVRAFPRRPLVWLALAGASLVVFLALDPYLWPDPIGRVADSVLFHVEYGHSPGVADARLPWYQQVVWLLEAAPTEWHPGVFPAGRITSALLPLALLGAPAAASRRPVWAAAALAGLAFLLVWPVKWPQYLLLILVPLAICAAHAPMTVVTLVRRARRARASEDAPLAS